MTRFSKRYPLSSKNAPLIDYKICYQKYVSDNRKIISTKITSVSYNKQRKLTKEIKKAKNSRAYINMELILLENILNLGNIGDKVKVKDRFIAETFFKKGKALRFNKRKFKFCK